MTKLTEIHTKIRSLLVQRESAMKVPVIDRGGSIDYLDKQIRNKIQAVFLHPDNDIACESLAGRCDWKKFDDVELCASCGRGRLCGR